MSHFFKKLFSETVPTQELLQGALDEELLDKEFIQKESLCYLFSRFDGKKQIFIHKELNSIKHFTSTVDFLIKNGADPTLSLNEGDLSPMQMATVNSLWSVVNVMLNASQATQEYFETNLPKSNKNGLDFLSKNPQMQQKLHLKKSSDSNDMDYSKINNALFFLDLITDKDFLFKKNQNGNIVSQITLSSMKWPTNYKMNPITQEINNLDSLALLYISGIPFRDTERRMVQKNISLDSFENLKNNLNKIKFQTHYSKEPINLFELYLLRLLNREFSFNSDYYVTLDSLFLKKMKLDDNILNNTIDDGISYKTLLFLGMTSKTNMTLKNVAKTIKWPYELDSNEGLSHLKKASEWLLNNKKIKNKKWLIESLDIFWSQYLWSHYSDKISNNEKPTFKVLNIISDLNKKGVSVDGVLSYLSKNKEDECYGKIRKHISNMVLPSYVGSKVSLDESFWLDFIFCLQSNSPRFPKSIDDTIGEKSLPKFIHPWVEKTIADFKQSPSLQTFWVEHLIQESLKNNVVEPVGSKNRF